MLVGYKTYLDRVPAAARAAPPRDRQPRRGRARAPRARAGGRRARASRSCPRATRASSRWPPPCSRRSTATARCADVEVRDRARACRRCRPRRRASARRSGHDFASISLSDILKPWAVVERRLEAAGAADLVARALQPGVADAARAARRGPRGAAPPSRAGDAGRRRARGRRAGGGGRRSRRSATLDLDVVDMRTLLIVGSSTTRVIAGEPPRVYTPRRYPAAERAPRPAAASTDGHGRDVGPRRAAHDDHRQPALARRVELGLACASPPLSLVTIRSIAWSSTAPARRRACTGRGRAATSWLAGSGAAGRVDAADQEPGSSIAGERGEALAAGGQQDALAPRRVDAPRRPRRGRRPSASGRRGLGSSRGARGAAAARRRPRAACAGRGRDALARTGAWRRPRRRSRCSASQRASASGPPKPPMRTSPTGSRGRATRPASDEITAHARSVQAPGERARLGRAAEDQDARASPQQVDVERSSPCCVIGIGARADPEHVTAQAERAAAIEGTSSFVVAKGGDPSGSRGAAQRGRERRPRVERHDRIVKSTPPRDRRRAAAPA